MNRKTLNLIILIASISWLVIPSFSSSSNQIYKQAVDYVISHNYMTTFKNGFNGDKYVTRNELAQIIYNMKSEELSWVNTTAKVLPNVVTIKCGNQQASGILLDEKHVLSCYHFYKDGEKIEVSNGYSKSIGTLISYDIIKDLALIEVNNNFSGIAKLKLATNLELSQEVITIGIPINNPKSVSKGIISNLRYDEGLANRIQFDMAMNYGNSGGAIFDINGNIVSIAISKINKDIGYGLSFGTTQSDLKEFLNENYYNRK